MQALDALGVTIDAVREAVQMLDLNDGLAVERRAALGQALRMALHEEAEMVGLRHFLAGVLDDLADGAGAAIRALGVTPDQVRRPFAPSADAPQVAQHGEPAPTDRPTDPHQRLCWPRVRRQHHSLVSGH